MRPMFDPHKAAIIGDADQVFGFRAMGFKVYSPLGNDEARRILEGLEQEGVALVLVHQKYLEGLEDLKKKTGKKFFPVVIGFSDHRDALDRQEAQIREMAVKATGSDSLVKGRGQDETR